MGLILDTSILIAGERRKETVKQVIQRVQATFGETEAAFPRSASSNSPTASTGLEPIQTVNGGKPSARNCAGT